MTDFKYIYIKYRLSIVIYKTFVFKVKFIIIDKNFLRIIIVNINLYLKSEYIFKT